MENPAHNPTVPDIEGYELFERLGVGGMGAVYLGRRVGSSQSESDDRVAVKLLASCAHSNEGQSDAQRRARFAREFRIMSQVDHPNIVAVLDHGTANGVDYLVMEYVPGRTLRDLMAEAGPLPVSVAAPILDAIAGALDHLHQEGIVHRDLSPGNVLLDADNRVKLTDFGIAAPVHELGAITKTGEFVGTLDYMSPEQRTRLPVDERADQFSLAVIAYELLTGKRPLGQFKPASKHRRSLGRGVDAVLQRGLQEDADDRYPEITEFARFLREALERSPGARRFAVAAAVLAAAVIVYGLASWQSYPAADDRDSIKTAAVPPANPETELVADPRPERVAYFTELADHLLSSRAFEEATEAMDEAIRLRPLDAALLQKRALVHKHNRMFQNAIDDLQAALVIEPEHIHARVGLASVYVRIKDYTNAIHILDDAVARDPKHAPAFAWRGWARHGAGDDEQARVDLDRAIELDADCGVAYQYRGILAKIKKDYAQARHDYLEFARCCPDDPYAHRTLASLFALCPIKKFRDGTLAVKHARRACELTKWDDYAPIRTLAYACFEAGDLRAAIDACDRAIRVAPENQRERLDQQRKGYQERYKKTAARR